MQFPLKWHAERQFGVAWKLIEREVTPEEMKITKQPNRHAMLCLRGGVLNRVDPFGTRCIMAALEGEGERFGLFLQDRIEERSAILKKLTEFKPDILWISIQPLTPKIFEVVPASAGAL